MVLKVRKDVMLRGLKSYVVVVVFVDDSSTAKTKLRKQIAAARVKVGPGPARNHGLLKFRRGRDRGEDGLDETMIKMTRRLLDDTE